ncbi:MAG: hypothetical protein HYU66_28730, partial [Armatimonadetes bacterium]|nr:hypothetical protein [Armatimonadota bacterium]
GAPQRGSVALACGRASRSVTFLVGAERGLVEGDLDLPADTPLWDEFSPELLTLTADLSAGTWRDRTEVTFGLRKLESVGKRLVLNGRTIFLRGTLECCIFPRTGFPPTDVESWLRILRVCRDYGLSHLRFHSWCPPEAAFAAADRMGFLYHVELPQWVGNVGQDPPRDAFVTDELRRIVAAYGNHPSFGMLCMGNELGGDASFLQKLVDLGKELDPRHLYTSATAWSQGPADQYDVCVVRGLRGPRTDHDFRGEDARWNVPVVSHEVGQWTFYPDLAEIPKYDGVLEARNFHRIRDDLAKKGLLERAPAFTMASGRWSAELYKEEIEVLLRTPGHGGFQLLDLHDFPGQGTSLIGILDPFWDSKGIVTPAWWRRFCSPTVPLLRLPKRVYAGKETLRAVAEVAHFGPRDLKGVAAEWTATDGAGREVGRGTLGATDIPTGGLTALGTISLDLAKVGAPAKLTLRVALPGTDSGNDWDVWVYPSEQPAEPPEVVLATRWEAAKVALAEGKRVLLTGTSGLRRSTQLGFTTVFWGPVMFPNQPGTMGLMYDPKHPALAAFPSDGYTDWQWYDVLQRARAIVLTDLPRELRPLVQVVDNFVRNDKLALAFECRVGEGRLLVCAADLDHNLASRPAARQLRSSLLAYAASDRFAPDTALTDEQLETLFGPSLLQVVPAAPSEGVVLRVRAAVNVPELSRDFAWEPRLDEVVTRADGFGYEVVSGATWRDTVGSAWHHGGNLVVRATVPKGFTGRLYAHFSDWNNLGRVAEVSFEGRELGTLDEYNGPGKWVAVPITAADSADGKIEIAAQPTVVNAMITEIVVAR